MNKKFRYEQKYLINYAEMQLLKMRISTIMNVDEHTKSGEYKIRSLYFDDYWNSAYNEKQMGVYKRKKYRIRIYNDSDSVIRLECKHKSDNYINKVSASLTREETEEILNGNYKFLLHKNDNSLYTEFYYQVKSRVLRPKVIVDYEREPFVCSAGDVRITFDKNVRSAYLTTSFFDSDLPTKSAIEPDKVILEVKFTQFMPNIIKKALACQNSEYVAFSKFVQCYENTSFAFLQDREGI